MKYFNYWAETISDTRTGFVHANDEQEAINKVCKMHNTPKWAVQVEIDPIATQDGI